MKYALLVFCFALLSMNSYSESISPSDIRNIKEAMYRAVESPRVTDSLYSELISKKSNSPLVLAYVGTLEALKAKHSWNPYNKLKFVAQAQKTLKIAIGKESDNLEIRFMRFSIQHYTPSFLGYSKELDEDRQAIIKQYRTKGFGMADELLIKSIAKFMIESKRCSPADVTILQKFA
jgi:hypothetical protein